MSVAVDTTAVVAALDEILSSATTPDYPDAHNGLQLANTGTVTRVAAAVDASVATVEAAASAAADFLLVHHGLLWGGGRPWVGRDYRRLATLIRGDIAVYGAHLPLDAHPDVGNNALLLRALGALPGGRFGAYQDLEIGWWGQADLTRDELVDRVRTAVGRDVFVMPFGPSQVQRIGVVTGGGGSMISEAHAAGLDAFVTGEGSHHTYFDAQELGITVIYAGHYATETFGVKALAELVAKRFGLPWSFIDLPTGL
jgi:dinuclear metal center YbgI/SA1388 family protein